VEVVRGLINQDASVEFACKDVCMPLSLEVQDGHLDVVRELLIHGSSLNFADKRGSIPLFVVHKTLLEDVQELLNHGAIVEFVDKNVRTTFLAAAQKGHVEIV
jgi:ankyrin repeat protein